MRKKSMAILLATAVLTFWVFPVYTEETDTGSIRDMVISETKQFSFRNGINWGMDPLQVSLIENIPMEQRSSSEWSVMVSEEPVRVSRFSADLI